MKKQILLFENLFINENKNFTKSSNIKITKIKENEYQIIIADYDNIPFTLKFCDNAEKTIIIKTINGYVTFVENYDIVQALIELGYYIGTELQ